ncbi:keratin-associated protein 11-1 [Choloepus didactylus]|uniref:keratin-associated protein 11-1 n=1 Tax=Choloepus didactylus TaxID=27675 RepID=UPI00189E31B7|nr:keratin-associated protein 11-1 [Choloepus didactylus]
MSFNCSARTCSSRPTGGRCTVPGVPVATAPAGDVDCLSGIYLPSSFQTGSWLLEHCRETNCEPTICKPTPCSRQTTCVPNPCSTIASSGCRPLQGISSVCQPVGGVSTRCQPACGFSKTYQRASCVSSCRKTC